MSALDFGFRLLVVNWILGLKIHPLVFILEILGIVHSKLYVQRFNVQQLWHTMLFKSQCLGVQCAI